MNWPALGKTIALLATVPAAFILSEIVPEYIIRWVVGGIGISMGLVFFGAILYSHFANKDWFTSDGDFYY